MGASRFILAIAGLGCVILSLAKDYLFVGQSGFGFSQSIVSCYGLILFVAAYQTPQSQPLQKDWFRLFVILLAGGVLLLGLLLHHKLVQTRASTELARHTQPLHSELVRIRRVVNRSIGEVAIKRPKPDFDALPDADIADSIRILFLLKGLMERNEFWQAPETIQSIWDERAYVGASRHGNFF